MVNAIAKPILLLLVPGLFWTAGPINATGAAEPATAKKAPAAAPSGLSGLGGSFDPGTESPGETGVNLFGLHAEGGKFVYVLDRSASTGAGNRTALAAIKAELGHSLDSLDSVQQFQLIFYNETPTIFNPTGQPGHLSFATDLNKQRARRFINALTPSGGTAHEDALKLAIRLQPDVIFLLTDAGEPKLEAAELERIRRWATAITINVVEFGSGPPSAEDKFLKQLARENNGRHVYVDLQSLAIPEAKK